MTVIEFKKFLDSFDNHVDVLTVQKRIENFGYIPKAVVVNPTRLYVVGKKESNRRDGIVIAFDYNYRASIGEVRFSPEIDSEKQEKLMKELYKPY
jgi:hypothetical protein